MKASKMFKKTCIAVPLLAFPADFAFDLRDSVIESEQKRNDVLW